MLKFMRKNAASTWIKATFLTIIIVFIFWGVGGMVGGEKTAAVAVVNGEIIGPNDLERAYDNLLDAYRNLYKEGFSPEMAEALGLKQRALDNLVRATLMRQEAQRLGLIATDEEVREAIRQLPVFREAGSFDRDLYQRILRANTLKPAEFEASQREDLLVRKVDDLVSSGVEVSDEEARLQFTYDQEKVALRYLRARAADAEAAVVLTEEEIAEYYKNHQDEFREPERVRAEVASYEGARIAATLQVEDAAVERYYQDHAVEFEEPERVTARHVLFEVAPDADLGTRAAKRAQAEAALARAKAGEDFAALARELSEDAATKEKGGDIGWFGRNQMVPPFEDAAFAAEAGTVVGEVVETQFGFHVIKVEEKKAGRTQPLHEVREQIVKRVRDERAEEVRRERATADRERARGGESLAVLAQASGAAVTMIGPVARGDIIPGLGRSPELMSAMFAAAAGEVGDVVDTPTAGYVFRVEEKLPARVPELSEIRDRVAAKARSEAAERRARERAAAWLERLKQAPDIDALAREEKLSVEEIAPFGRASTVIAELGDQADLVRDAFALRSDKSLAPSVYPAGGDSVVAVLKERIAADEAKFAEQKETIKQQYRERRRRQVSEALVDELKARSTIEIQPEYLALLAGSGTRGP